MGTMDMAPTIFKGFTATRAQETADGLIAKELYSPVRASLWLIET